MNKKTLEKLGRRDSALDIIRIVAVASVISVHFFLNTGFYSQPVSGTTMYFMVMVRSFFSICVPLFMLLTGYLMCQKTLSKKYYKGIIHTVIIYVLSAIFCMIFKAVHDGNTYTFKSAIFGVLDFTGANYSWYIEMYIGLFLIAPFLNLAYNKLANKKQKQVLVLTFVALTIIPTVFNIFNFDTLEWWTNPVSSDTFQKLFPSWWMGFYPVTYYFVGCYLREYGLKLKTGTLFVLLAVTTILFGTFNYFRSYGGTFKSGIYVYWYGFEPFVSSVLVFALLMRIKTDKFSNPVKFCLWKVSDLALGIYLTSYVFDRLIYGYLCKQVPITTDRFPYMLLTVPAVFICSALASAILNLLSKVIVALYKGVVNFIKKQRERADKYKWQDCIFVALILAGIIFSLWKCFYGFGGNDEAFYLTIPHRILMGDSFFGDEWNLSQLSALLLMPFVWVFETITGSTEGMILAARFVYVVFHATVAVVIYTRLRKYGYISVFACVLFFIYTPYDIMAMSYDSMGVDFIALTGAILGTADFKKKLPLIVSGFTFAAAVLCCPHLIAAYALFALCVVVHILIRKKEINFVLKSELFSPKTFLCFTIGAAVLAVIFAVVALSRASIGEMLSSFPYLMNDPEHISTSFAAKLTSYFKTSVTTIPLFSIGVYAYVFMAIIMLLDRKRTLHRSVYLSITVAIVVYSLVLTLPKLTSSNYNAIMYPMIFIGITSYVLCKNKPRELFASLFLLGVIYSICIHFASNQYFYVISMTMATTNLASYIFLAQLIREMSETDDNVTYALAMKRTAFAAVAFMIILQAGLQISVKANHCFWEAGAPSTLTSKITSGPAKGIYTNQTNCNTYESINNDITAYYGSKEPDKILFLCGKSWTYLTAEDYPYGTLSAWMSENEASFNRLLTYYEVNPEQKPKYVYIPKQSAWDLTRVYQKATEYGYSVDENDISYKLEKTN